MHKQQAPMRAAIDIGSNTIHIVVARCKPDDLDGVVSPYEPEKGGHRPGACAAAFCGNACRCSQHLWQGWGASGSEGPHLDGV